MCAVNVSYGENNVNVGPLKEIPEICVDHFFEDDLNSSAFFLSHAHTDHMVGLESPRFTRRLADPGVKLYCHLLTPLLLETFSRYLGGKEGVRGLIFDRKLVPLEAGKPYRLEIPPGRGRFGGGDSFIATVTLLSAGHCPGSVMFLFETESLRVLHTGDFRMKVSDLKLIPHLHVQSGFGVSGEVKKIDHLYIDTTFCSNSASLFPCRKEVIQKAIEHVRDWISSSQKHWVFIKFAAKFAHEYILLELYKTFEKKIHVTPERMYIYSQIPHLANAVTLDPRTPFHFCGDRACLQEGEFIEMRLTSMWYILSSPSESGTKETVVRTAKRLNVCYSMHSSLQEIAATIDYLRPKVVTPLVLPFRSTLKEVWVKASLLRICNVPFIYKDYHGDDDETPISDVNLSMDVQPLDSEVPAEIENPDEDIDDDAPNSPVFSDSSPVRVKYEGKFAWSFNLTPSPIYKRPDSESSGSQHTCSQEENDVMKPPVCISPSPNVKKNLFPTTPPIHIEKITSCFEQRKRALSSSSPSSLATLARKKLKVSQDSSDELYKHDQEEACCSRSLCNRNSNYNTCDNDTTTTVIDLTSDSETDYESNSSNSQSLLSSQ